MQVKFLNTPQGLSVVALSTYSNLLVYNVERRFEGELTLTFNSLFGKNKITCFDFSEDWNHF